MKGKVKGETVLFEFTKKYQKVPGTFAMVPDPRTRDVRLRLRPHNSILRHVWALNGKGDLTIRAKVKVKIAWQVREGKVKSSSLTLEGKGHPSGG